MNSRQYELVYVVSPAATDQEVADLHAQIESICGRYQGVIARTENWGRRKLAYEIEGHRDGTYVLEVIDGGGELMKEIDRRLRVNEQVLRHLVVRVDEELRAAERTRARRQTDAQRRTERIAATAGQAPVEAPAPAADEDTGEEAEA